jgi:uncharacterized RDD family membrane protein YckC
MRCPKCHYLSFEPEPRCRNCGYGLGLDDPAPGTAEEPVADLPLRPLEGADGDPAATTSLTHTISTVSPSDLEAPEVPMRLRGPFDAPVAAPPASGLAAPPPVSTAPSLPVPPPRPVATAAASPPPAAKTAASRPAPPPQAAGRAASPPPPTTELPLFVTRSTTTPDAETAEEESEPLVAVPAEPRPPLAVRRPAADTGARRPSPAAHPRKLGPLDRDLLEDLQRIEKEERRAAAATHTGAPLGTRESLPGALSRATAAAIDAALIGGLSAAVLGVTMRWLDLPIDQIRILPIVPTAAFLLIVGLGYLLVFTAAGGQTIGKMAVGIRVVGTREAGDELEGMLSVRQAVVREVLTIPSVLAFGAGFLPGLFGEQRAIHDRLAHTRVVRA